LKREIAVLDVQLTAENTKTDRLAFTLRNVAHGWTVADQEERNRLTKMLFENIIIEKDNTITVQPHTEFAPFFALDATEKGRLSRPSQRIGLAEVTGLEPAVPALTRQGIVSRCEGATDGRRRPVRAASPGSRRPALSRQ